MLTGIKGRLAFCNSNVSIIADGPHLEVDGVITSISQLKKDSLLIIKATNFSSNNHQFLITIFTVTVKCWDAKSSQIELYGALYLTLDRVHIAGTEGLSAIVLIPDTVQPGNWSVASQTVITFSGFDV